MDCYFALDMSFDMVHGFGESVAQGLFEKLHKVPLFNQTIFGISLSLRHGITTWRPAGILLKGVS